jgi:hypothetical protein
VIARRVVALAVAVGLVAGAWLVRSRVIDDDPDAGGPSTRDARELVCTRDFERICNELASGGLDDTGDSDVHVTVEDAAVTLDRLRDVDPDELPLWLAVDPYPAMLDSLRTGARQAAAEWSTTELASSPIALVSPAAKIAALAAECPEPDVWLCVGELAGDRWSDIDPALGGPSGNDTVRPAFAPVDRYGVGLLALGQATAGWFGSDPVNPEDPSYFAWLRSLTGQVSERALSSGTPIGTIVTRPSALDVAVGAEAELGSSPDPRFGVAYAGPMTSADVVLAAPAGTDVPDGLVGALSSRLTATGWDEPSDAASGALEPTSLLALQALWEDISR